MPWLILTTMMLAPPIANGETLRIEQLVEALKSPDYRQREAATAQLKTRGRSLFPLLKEVVQQSDSPEQIWRAKEILTHFENQQLDALMLEPSRIQLPDGATTLGKALQTLQKDNDSYFAARDAKLFEQPIVLPISKPMTYWEAFALIAKSGKVRLVEMEAAAKSGLPRLAKWNSALPKLDANLVSAQRNYESDLKTVARLEAELKEAVRKGLQNEQKEIKANLQVAQARQALYYQVLIRAQQQSVAYNNRQRMLQHTYVLESGSPNLVHDVGSLRLWLTPLSQSAKQLPLRIGIEAEPGVTLGSIESVLIDQATDVKGHALNVETHPFTQPVEIPEGQIVVFNKGGPIGVNGQLIQIGPGQQIVFNRQGGMKIEPIGSHLRNKLRSDIPMLTLSGFAEQSRIGKLRGRLRVRAKRSGMILQELDAGSGTLKVGDMAQTSGISVKILNIQKVENENHYSLEIVYHPSVVELGHSPQYRGLDQLNDGLPISGRVQELQMRRVDGSVPLPSHLIYTAVELVDSENRPDAFVSMCGSQVTSRPRFDGSMQLNFVLKVTPNPHHLEPTKLRVYGTRSRMLTVPFEFQQ